MATSHPSSSPSWGSSTSLSPRRGSSTSPSASCTTSEGFLPRVGSGARRVIPLFLWAGRRVPRSISGIRPIRPYRLSCRATQMGSSALARFARTRSAIGIPILDERAVVGLSAEFQFRSCTVFISAPLERLLCSPFSMDFVCEKNLLDPTSWCRSLGVQKY